MKLWGSVLRLASASDREMSLFGTPGRVCAADMEAMALLERLPSFAVEDLCPRGQAIVTESSWHASERTHDVVLRGIPGTLRAFEHQGARVEIFLRRLIWQLEHSELPILRLLGVFSTRTTVYVVNERFQPAFEYLHDTDWFRIRVKNMEWALSVAKALETLHNNDVVLEYVTPQSLVVAETNVKFDPLPYYRVRDDCRKVKPTVNDEAYVAPTSRMYEPSRLNNVYGVFRLLLRIPNVVLDDALREWERGNPVWVTEGGDREPTASSLVRCIEQALLDP